MANALMHMSEGGEKIDSACAARRKEVKEKVDGHHPGDRLPEVVYDGEEDALWHTVISQLSRIQPDLSCARYLAAASRVRLPDNHVPSLREVSDQLRRHTGFQLLPAGDLVQPRDFYPAFDAGYFYCAMYMRCPAVPLYSPDPDVLHELTGHAVMLSDPLFADLYRAFGSAAARATSDDQIQDISKVFWYTMETGLVRESDGFRAYGAALLSSVGELESITKVSHEEFSIEKMLNQPYDIYQYQPKLFVVDSIDILAREIRDFLSR
jgi:phenylalanine-4-hydroxylase